MHSVSSLVPKCRYAGRLKRWPVLLVALVGASMLLTGLHSPQHAAATHLQDDEGCPLVGGTDSYVAAGADPAPTVAFMVAGVDPGAAPTVEISENGVLCYFLSAPPAELYSDPNVAQVRSLVISVGFTDTRAQFDRIVERALSTGAEVSDPQTVTFYGRPQDPSVLGPRAAWWIKRTPGNPDAKTKTYGLAFQVKNRQRQERVVSIVVVTDLGTDHEEQVRSFMLFLALDLWSNHLP